MDSGTDTNLICIQPGNAEQDPVGHARRARVKERALSILTPIAFLLLWEFAAYGGWLDTRFFPAPSQIAVAAVSMLASGSLQKDLAISITRVLLGFALGVASGLVAGLILGLSQLTRAALDPFFSALYTVPKLAILPLLLLIFGLGETPKILVIATTVFFIVWISCMEAVITIPYSYREVALSFGANRWEMFKHVIWPALLPPLFVSMRISIGMAVLVLVGVEFVQADVGIGYRIWHSWSLFQPKEMYVGICAIAILGVVFAALIKIIGDLLIPWARTMRER